MLPQTNPVWRYNENGRYNTLRDEDDTNDAHTVLGLVTL
jgi:hypothetical protein